jgi:uncharacterized protein YbjT (DUF2867 family)
MAPIAVIGATGGVGQEAVKQLLAQQREVRAIGRSKERLEKEFGTSPGLQLVQASVEDVDSLKAALDGVSGVINASSGKTYFSASAVDFKGGGNVAEAAKAVGAHVVLISSCLVTKQHRFHPMRLLLNNIRYGLMDNKLKGEDLLRQSGAKYTIIRPGGLTNTVGGKEELKIGQGDKGSPGRVSRADVAAVALAALEHLEASNRKTIELSSQPMDAPKADQLQHIFDGTTADA